MIDEKEILRLCIRNNPKGQRLLYEKYASGLLGICMRYSKDKAEAEDVLQEGFVKIFANIKDFEGRSSLIGWMRRIVINTSITMYHKNLKHQYHYDVDDFRDRNIGDCELDDTEFTLDEMLNVIRDLPPGYRMVFNLYAIEGYKHKEIAEKMEIDINTSKSQYSRAKKLIQCRLAALKAETRKK
jgi:RNA polymerase sigma factor (sigma-70 family)